MKQSGVSGICTQEMHFNLKQTENWRCGVGVSMVQGCCYTEGHPRASWAQLSADTYLELTIKLLPVARCAKVEIFFTRKRISRFRAFSSFLLLMVPCLSTVISSVHSHFLCKLRFATVSRRFLVRILDCM